MFKRVVSLAYHWDYEYLALLDRKNTSKTQSNIQFSKDIVDMRGVCKLYASSSHGRTHGRTHRMWHSHQRMNSYWMDTEGDEGGGAPLTWSGGAGRLWRLKSECVLAGIIKTLLPLHYILFLHRLYGHNIKFFSVWARLSGALWASHTHYSHKHAHKVELHWGKNPKVGWCLALFMCLL